METREPTYEDVKRLHGEFMAGLMSIDSEIESMRKALIRAGFVVKQETSNDRG